MAELRRDPIARNWTIVAPARSARPDDHEAHDVCPFCPGNEHQTPEEILAYRDPGTAANRPGWWVRCFINRFPALVPDVERVAARAVGMYDAQTALGRHEVIVETPEHAADMATMPHAQLAEVFWAYRDRIRALAGDTHCAYILPFRNHGQSAGASLLHPHSQIIAPAIVPPRVGAQAEHALEYLAFRGRCAWCDAVAQEIAEEVRVVVANERFIAVAPFASRVPFEIAILPVQHAPSPASLDRPAIDMLAAIVGETCARLRAHLGADVAYNLMVRMAPRWPVALDEAYHWHIEIVPRTNAVPAGFEFATGMFINTVAPEQAAATLRGMTSNAAV